LAKNLSKFGIVPRKTYNSTIILPKNKKLHKHFIRGYLDADGWISIKKDRTYEYVNIGICSYLKDNLDIVAKNIPVPDKEPKKIKTRNLYELRYYSKTDIEKVINYLFDDSVYLEIKWKKIVIFFSQYIRKLFQKKKTNEYEFHKNMMNFNKNQNLNFLWPSFFEKNLKDSEIERNILVCYLSSILKLIFSFDNFFFLSGNFR
jgi:hypothetical protein